MQPRATLEGSIDTLAGRELRFEAVVIGGTALNLLGVISRATKDCDILEPPLPSAIGPASLTSVLPAGWRARLQTVFSGSSLSLRCLGRADLLRSKLFALCDRGIDLGDCIVLAPSGDELRDLMPWLEYQAGNPDWPAHVRATMSDLARRLGHGV